MQPSSSIYATSSLDNRTLSSNQSGNANASTTTTSRLEDLPRVIQLAIKYSNTSGRTNKLIFIPVAAVAATVLCLTFMAITQNVVMGITMGLLCFFSFLQSSFGVDLTLAKNSLFIDILAQSRKQRPKILNSLRFYLTSPRGWSSTLHR